MLWLDHGYQQGGIRCKNDRTNAWFNEVKIILESNELLQSSQRLIFHSWCIFKEQMSTYKMNKPKYC